MSNLGPEEYKRANDIFKKILSSHVDAKTREKTISLFVDFDKSYKAQADNRYSKFFCRNFYNRILGMEESL